MRYIPNTPEDRRKMLDAIGAAGFEELISDVPEGLLTAAPPDIPGHLDELSLMREISRAAEGNVGASGNACFLGAGAYDHFIPTVVGHLSSRSEFVTSYTPYQAEVSQGTLQATYEFQSMMSELFGMDAANASMYDGASAMAEAALMARRVTKRDGVVVSKTVHPHYREVLDTYLSGLGPAPATLGYLPDTGTSDLGVLSDMLADKSRAPAACVIAQYPNFFGCIEDIRAAAGVAHEAGALLVVVADPISLGLLESPGMLGADIVVSEGQPLGIPLSYGGPYLGLFGCRKEHLRQMPGRVAGKTTDGEGRVGYVLTLQTREQHIRREKATSNICTNEALMALRATVYLAAMGKAGLRRVGELCLQKAHYLLGELEGRAGLSRAFGAPFFKEFAVRVSGDIERLNASLLEKGIIGGLDLGGYYPELEGCMLIAVTEKRTKAEMDLLIDVVRVGR